MGKRNFTCKDDDDRVIYKNSNNTFNTYSKVCSSTSKIFTKSLIMELRKKISHSDIYELNGKLKRDLSIETDVCRMIRILKTKMRKHVNPLSISENKNSTTHMEINTNDGFQGSSIGSGDSKPDIKEKNAHFNIDLASMIMDNLKGLLNNWIKKYLLENNETKQKIETVLDSILHKLELQTTKTSSSCTYTLDIEIVNKKISSHHSDFHKDSQKQSTRSHYTIPLRGKHLKIISTLSVPRNLQKVNTRSLYEINNHNSKYLYVSMKKNKRVLDHSSLNILSVSTKTLTKRCATYQKTRHEKVLDDKWASYIPRPSNSTLSTNKIDVKSDQITKCVEDKTQKCVLLDKDQNIPKSMSFDDLHYLNKELCVKEVNFAENKSLEQSDAHLNLDNNNNTKSALPIELSIKPEQKSNIRECSNSILQIDFQNQSADLLNAVLQNVGRRRAKNRMKEYVSHSKRMNKHKKKPSKNQNCHNIDSKRHSCLFKKSKLRLFKEKDMLKYFQKVCQNFANYIQTNDLKFDIHINVISGRDNVNKNGEETFNQPEKDDSETSKNISDDLSRNMQNQFENCIEKTFKSSSKPIIIPLLDGSASHAKYFMSRETSTDNCDQIAPNEDNNNIEIKNIDIAHEITELREIVRELTATAEKFVKLQLHYNYFSYKNSNHSTENKTDSLRIKCHSKGIQISNIMTKSNLASGVKLKKSPKKNSSKEFNPRLVKKSTSYHIIDSETILKVTDMTSAAADVTTDKVTDEALTCSFPRSKSLFEVSIGSNKHKLLAFYCDDFIKPDYAYNHNVCSLCSCGPCPSRNQAAHIKPPSNYVNSCIKNPTLCNLRSSADYCTSYEDCEGSSSVLVDVCDIPSDKKFVIYNREVTWWEGCLYCILLWIPVLVITWLLYVYVFKDVIDKIRGSSDRKMITRNMITNSSHFSLELSDLGF